MNNYANKRIITGSIRHKAYMKRGVLHTLFRASIFNPVTNKQISKEFSIGKHGTQARQMAIAALNDMRHMLVNLGCNVSFEDLQRAPMPRDRYKVKGK